MASQGGQPASQGSKWPEIPPNGGILTLQRGQKTPKKGYFDRLGGGPDRGLARPEAYAKPENAGFARRAVVGCQRCSRVYGASGADSRVPNP